MRRPAVDRFAEKVALTDSGCLEWIGGTARNGYGTFFLPDGGAGKNVGAHRWSYEYHVGPVPEGLHLDHLCRNRKCVNVDHLEPVTCQTNILRGEGSAAERAKLTHCPAGHPYSGANLYVPPGKRERHCKQCNVDRNRAYRLRKKAA